MGTQRDTHDGCLCLEFGVRRALDVMELARVRHLLPEVTIHPEREAITLCFPVADRGHQDRVQSVIRIHGALDMLGMRAGIDYWIEGLRVTDHDTPMITLPGSDQVGAASSLRD
jgi:hypothetical protein